MYQNVSNIIIMLRLSMQFLIGIFKNLYELKHYEIWMFNCENKRCDLKSYKDLFCEWVLKYITFFWVLCTFLISIMYFFISLIIEYIGPSYCCWWFIRRRLQCFVGPSWSRVLWFGRAVSNWRKLNSRVNSKLIWEFNRWHLAF